ncbi:hypothetical protein E3T55_10535 [Cryobacterium frigoriphilum]|uniref:Uncharacterized protein n=1 Tax=Cryobacterium frigoriphilum TaxID=1259150 RepID=A0A4R9A0N1_9MICO|nr:hypothetical protein [Cryobacterium frigoriphilum]TFD49857.1 hypothetical protein E3T55_10535 [Cryobacterium frigoriphilum]
MVIFLLIAILAATIGLIWAAVVRGRASEAFRRVTVPANLAGAVRDARKSFAGRIGIAFAASAVAFSAMNIVHTTIGNGYGLTWLLTPGLMTGFFLVVVAALPKVLVPEVGAKRSADLARRRPWSYAPAWALVLPAASGLLLLAAIVAFGVTSSPQEDGLDRSLTLTDSPYSNTAGPYPGWYYGLPLALLVALITIAAAVALARVAASSRPTDESLRQVDRVMRVLATRIIMKLTSGTFVAYLGGLLLLGSKAMMSASNQWQNTVYVHIEPWYTLAPVGLITGLLLLVVGCVLLVLAAIDALKPPFTAGDASIVSGRPEADAA